MVYDPVRRPTLRDSFRTARSRGLVVNYGSVGGSVDDLDPIELGEAGSVFLSRPRHLAASDKEAITTAVNGPSGYADSDDVEKLHHSAELLPCGTLRLKGKVSPAVNRELSSLRAALVPSRAERLP